MLFVALLKIKPTAPPMAEGVARRAQYQLPPGSRLVAEYWLQTNDPAVLVVFEADSVAPIMAIRAVWNDASTSRSCRPSRCKRDWPRRRPWRRNKDVWPSPILPLFLT